MATRSRCRAWGAHGCSASTRQSWAAASSNQHPSPSKRASGLQALVLRRWVRLDANYDISQDIKPRAEPGADAETIAAMMLALQHRGCHNVNLVTPEHVVPQVIEAIAVAADAGLRLPIVYNTSADDSLESIALLNGIVDIYMPDFKYWSREASRRYLKADDYPDAARGAIKAMHEQVGALVLDGDGLARRGLLIRHLVMPGALEETRQILEWVGRELGPGT